MTVCMDGWKKFKGEPAEKKKKKSMCSEENTYTEKKK